MTCNLQNCTIVANLQNLLTLRQATSIAISESEKYFAQSKNARSPEQGSQTATASPRTFEEVYEACLKKPVSLHHPLLHLLGTVLQTMQMIRVSIQISRSESHNTRLIATTTSPLASLLPSYTANRSAFNTYVSAEANRKADDLEKHLELKARGFSERLESLCLK